MAEKELDDIEKSLEEISDNVESIQKHGETRHKTIKESELKPSYLLGDVLEKLGPLTAYVVADGDVTRAEMVDKSQNEYIKTLIKPLQEAFASANKRYKDGRKLAGETQITATEDLKKLQEWDAQVKRYQDRLKTIETQSTERRDHIRADLQNFEKQRDELEKKQEELDKRWEDAEKVLNPPDDEPLWKKIGWGLAGMRDEDDDNILSDREELEESCRQDQRVIDDQTDVNDKAIENLEGLIQQEQVKLRAANDRLEDIDTLLEDIPETIKETERIIGEYNYDISSLDKISGEMENMFPLLDDATAEAKVGFKIAYREKFAQTILTITTQLPVDEEVKRQIVLLIDAFNAMPKDSKLYANLQPQIEIARQKIGQQAIKSA